MQTLSGDVIKDIGALNLGDVDAFVPGLSVNAAQSTRPIISLRGVGTEDFGIGTDSPVGVYTDGVYTGKTGGSLLNFNDVKRIEVIKGPQGTLFGRNSAAGAISVVTNDPVDYVQATALARIGTLGTRHIELLYNTPLAEGLALRISAINQQDNGWVRNAYNGEKMGDDGDRGIRTSLRWHDEKTEAILSWEHEVMRQSGPPVFSLTGGKIDFGPSSTWTDPKKQPLVNDASLDRQSRTFDGVTLRVSTELPFATFSSTSAYRHFNTQNWQDNDASANPAAYLGVGNVESNSTWQQEFKLNGQVGIVDWVAGVSAYRERATEVENTDLTTTSLDTVVGHSAGIAPYATLTRLARGIGMATGNIPLSGLSLMGLPWQEAISDKGDYRSYAVYGDTIWKLDPLTNLTFGGRLTHDEKTFSWYSPPRAANDLDAKFAELSQANFFPAAVALKFLTPQQAGLLQAVATRNVAFANLAAKKAPLSSHKSWNNFSPRVVFDRHLTPDHMAYASWSKGFLSGGFDAVDVDGHYDEELVTNLEIGLKGRVRALGLTYDASVFRYDYTNLQSLTLVNSTGIPSYQVVNSDQRANGVEINTQWRLTGTWRLNAGIAYLDQSYAHYVTPGGAKLDGQPVGTPRLSATLGARAGWKAFEGQADFNVMLGYIGEHRCNADTSAQGTCGGAVGVGVPRQKIDASLDWTAPSGKWGVGLSVHNLTDKQYVTVSTLGAAVGSPYAFISKPRVATFQVKAAF